MGPQTVVADIAERLALRVATGGYVPGNLVPSVRQVAVEFDINRATAQLVLGRLESSGFVEAIPGKGFAVRAVRELGGVEVYRRLFRLSICTPEVAVEMFADIVDIVRQIAMDAVLDYSATARDHDIAPLKAAVEELDTVARTDEPDHARMFAIEMGLVRRLLAALGRGMQRAIFNSLAETILDVPEAVEAFYASAPDMHVLVWRAILAAWGANKGPSDAQLALFEDLFTLYHGNVLTRFRELVGAGEVSPSESQAATA
ncbi:GntR family transcriptional regulator [Mycobacteroides chelonae]|uniref:GntR family transcriptional regulator n=1 Tax=Mycobacteroides chelonae TaxID=1774 RepID=UPI0009945C9C|nr:GntR family transcriptional regulator [Mycobacteroides chelonae]